jgi:sulfur carrier protein
MSFDGRVVKPWEADPGVHTPADGGIEPRGVNALTPHCVKNRADWPATAASGDNTRMQIQLNGEPRAIAAQTTVLQLVQAEGLGERRVAVEVNGEIVPRGRHGEHALSDGDRVEIVHALGGG